MNGRRSRRSRRSIIVVENFYADPEWVRRFALGEHYYLPYEDEAAVECGQQSATWWSSWYRRYDDCRFKKSRVLMPRLAQIVGEDIDIDHWQASYPVDDRSKPLANDPRARSACLWNCSFHVKLGFGQQLGQGVHNHVTDRWNSVGPDGWAGIVYLTPDAPIRGGLHLWQNHDPERQFDWMSPAQNWQLVDMFANVCNRLILCRGDLPHSGADGWGSLISTGRMFQTFFFRTTGNRERPVAIDNLSA